MSDVSSRVKASFPDDPDLVDSIVLQVGDYDAACELLRNMGMREVAAADAAPPQKPAGLLELAARYPQTEHGRLQQFLDITGGDVELASNLLRGQGDHFQPPGADIPPAPAPAGAPAAAATPEVGFGAAPALDAVDRMPPPADDDDPAPAKGPAGDSAAAVPRSVMLQRNEPVQGQPVMCQIPSAFLDLRAAADGVAYFRKVAVFVAGYADELGDPDLLLACVLWWNMECMRRMSTASGALLEGWQRGLAEPQPRLREYLANVEGDEMAVPSFTTRYCMSCGVPAQRCGTRSFICPQSSAVLHNDTCK